MLPFRPTPFCIPSSPSPHRGRRGTSAAVAVAVALLACQGATVSSATSALTSPTFSPPAGAVTAGTVVTISSTTTGAAIYSGQTNPPTARAATFIVSAAGTWYAQDRLGGESSAVSSAAYTILSSIPVAPSNLAATADSATSVHLSWNDSSANETGFDIERAPDVSGQAGTFAQVGTAAAGATAFSDSALMPSTTYWYRVRAANGTDLSAYSASAHATTQAIMAPTFSPPAGGVVAGTVVTVSSTTVGASLWAGPVNPPTALASTFTVNAAGTWYAQATLAGHSSAVSSATYTIATAPAAPSNLVAAAESDTSIHLTWTDGSANETGFYVERAPDVGGQAGTFVQVGTTGVNATTFQDSGLSPSTTYWYRVRAFNVAGTSAYTASAQATTSAAAAVATPIFTPPAGPVSAGTVVIVSSTTTQASISTGQTNPPTTTSATFTVEAAGTWYAQAELGSQSSAVASAAYTLTSSSAPNAPGSLYATTASSTSLDLGWTDNSSNETGFYIERAPDAGGHAGTFVEVGSVGADVTSFSNTGLSAGTTYWYRVRAYNASGGSAYTNLAQGTTAGGGVAFTTTTCPDATQLQSYTCTLAASGGTGPYTFSVVNSPVSAPLPEGMTLNAATGQITSAGVGGQGTYGVQFRVADSTNHAATEIVMFPIAGNNAYLASIFPSTSIFHHRMDTLPLDTSPAAPIYSGYQSSSLRVFFGHADYANLPNGIPAIMVPSGQTNVPVGTTVYQSYFTSGPIPTSAPVEGTSAGEFVGGDRHVLVYRQAGGGQTPALYEMWQGILLNGGAWTDSSNALWPDVSSNALTPQGGGTTDAAGLPIAPLLLNADEVIGTGTPSSPNGSVQHPVRFTTNHILAYWVWPGTQTAGVGTCSNGSASIPQGNLLSQSAPPTSCTMTGPAGEIYRLKASTATPACASTSPQAAIIIAGFRNYGIILCDNGMTGGLIGTPDTRWNDADLQCLTNLTLGDFEPVNVSSLMVDPGSGATTH